jgi:hypothetical protein
MPIHALEPIVTYWKESFDWRKSEKKLNQFHHFLYSVDGCIVRAKKATVPF